MSLAPGTRIGPYEIVSLIGAGGMGEVYEARDPRLSRRVALKVLPAAQTADERSRERLMQEARAAAQLDHPHICTVYEVGEQDGHAFIAMQLVEGETLDHRIRRAPMSTPTLVGIARQVAEALAAAHSRGIVHRDVKPQNVMVSSGDYVRVLDFGLAKDLSPAQDHQETVRQLTMTGQISGTVPYMSPEQLRGEPVDARSDIFSFGTMLFEMAVRAHPFASGNAADTTSAILTRDPVSADFPGPPELRRIVRKCLEKDRDRRYQSTRDLVVDLDHFSRDDVAPQPVASKRRVPWIAIGAAAAILLAAGAFAYLEMGKKAAPAIVPVPITNFSESAVAPSLSADGRMVAFIRDIQYFLGSGDIYVKTLPDGEPQRLTNDSRPKYAPVFSPDGRRVAFTVITAKAKFDTFTVPVTNGEATSLLPNAAGLAWINSQHVLFSEMAPGLHMGVFTATEGGEEKRKIYMPEQDRGMVHYSYPSPDGKWLLLVVMNKQSSFDRCRVVPLDGGSSGHEVGPRGQCLLAAWSPDNRTMYFSADVAGARHLWRQPFPDGAVERIDLGPTTEEEGLAVSPKGDWLITSIGNRHSSLLRHTADGDTPLSPEGDEFLKAITSGDLKTVYFLTRASAGQPLQLKRMTLASRQVEPLVPDHEVVDYDVSRDEKLIAFSTPAREVWVGPIDHSAPPHLVVPNASEVRFAAQNDLVVVRRDGPSNYLERLGIDGSAPTRLPTRPFLDEGDVSFDGRWVVEVDTPLSYRAIPVYGGEPTPELCPDEPCRFQWSRDGRWLYATWITDGGSNNVAAIPLKPGESFPPIPAGADDPLMAWLSLPGVHKLEQSDVSPSPDPSVYVFRHETRLTNLFRVNLGGR